MSHSRRKYPIVRQERVDKKCWNRRIRHSTNEAYHGAQYKKVFVNYDNWSYRWSLQEALVGWSDWKSPEEIKSYWEKVCIRK